MRSWFIAGLMLAGLATAAVASPVPLKAYVERPQVSSPAVAPDGHAVAILVNRQGSKGVEIYDASGQMTHLMSGLRGDIYGISWIDSTHVAIFLHGVLPETDVSTRSIADQVLSWNPEAKSSVALLSHMYETPPIIAGGSLLAGVYRGRSVLFMVGLTRGPVFDFYAADADTGHGTLITGGGLQSLNWVSTTEGELLAKSERDVWGGGVQLFVKQPRGWRPVSIPPASSSFYLVGLGRAPGTVLLSRAAEWIEVTQDGAVSPPLESDGRHRPLAVSDHASGRLIALTSLDRDVPPMFFDSRLSAAWPGVLKGFPGKAVEFYDTDDDRKNILVYTQGADDPGSYYWVDLTKHMAVLIDERRPLLHGALSPIDPFTFPASDGALLSGSLTHPAGRSGGPPPAVVLVDSGENLSGYSGYAQGLASLGYGVVRVAFRGASGQGPALERAGHGEIGRRMQTDLSDAVAYLERTGRIAAGRVCILGEGNYAGYAALAGVTLQRGVYRCAIASDPAVDLWTMLRRPPPYESGPGWDRALKWADYAGDAATRPAELRALSPLASAANADAPVLIFYETLNEGAESAGRQMTAALQRAHKVVVSETYDPSVAVLGDASGDIRVLEQAAAFLAQYNPVSPP